LFLVIAAHFAHGHAARWAVDIIHHGLAFQMNQMPASKTNVALGRVEQNL
jgi:hypothetical protein